MDSEFVSELERIIGKDYVSTREDILLTYSTSASMGYDSMLPCAVVRLGSTEEVSEILKIANKYNIPITPKSGGSSLQGEVIPQLGGLVVEILAKHLQ